MQRHPATLLAPHGTSGDRATKQTVHAYIKLLILCGVGFGWEILKHNMYIEMHALLGAYTHILLLMVANTDYMC